MLESFCSASRIKAFTYRVHSSTILQTCSEILHQCLDAGVHGTLKADIGRFLPYNPPSPVDPKVSLLGPEIIAALRRSATHLSKELPSWFPSDFATVHIRLRINGVVFSNYTTNIRNSIVFYQPSPDGGMQPGIIRELFTMYSPNGQAWPFLAIHAYLPSEVPGVNIFTDWPDFGASLFSTNYSPNIDIIPTSRPVFHAIRRVLQEGSQVLKSLERVYHFLFLLSQLFLTCCILAEFVEA